MPEPQLPPQPGSPPEAPMPRSDSIAPVRVKSVPRHEVAASPGDRLGVRTAGRIIGSLIVAGANVLSVYYESLLRVSPYRRRVRARQCGWGRTPCERSNHRVAVQDNQHVKQDQLLFVVEATPYRSAVDKAEADLALTNLQIGALSDSIRAARARQTQLQADAAYNKQYLDRIQPLLSRHFVTANDVSTPAAAWRWPRPGRTHSEVCKAQNDLGQYGDINARRKAAQDTLYDARLNVEYCYVRAPFDAYVTNLNIAVGQLRKRGQRSDEPGGQSHLVCVGKLSRELPRLHPARDEGGSLPVKLSQQANRRPACGVWDRRSTRATARESLDCRKLRRSSTGCGSHDVSRCESYWKAAVPLSPSAWEQPRS
jgi:Biotin-lipoyl like